MGGLQSREREADVKLLETAASLALVRLLDADRRSNQAATSVKAAQGGRGPTRNSGTGLRANACR